MPCFYPMRAYPSQAKDPVTGKRSLLFNPMQGIVDQAIRLPCGQCVGCRLERSRQWAMRCLHESKLYERNCFITLTYATEHLPANGSLVVRDWQLFMKRFRKRFGPRIRFYACGEYGENFGRPHYHACIFNFDFDDKVLEEHNHRGEPLYSSPALSELWPQGRSRIGAVTFETAAYVARYVMKKITGDAAEAHYQGRKPEFTVMSRRPGIGRGWYELYQGDVYPLDEVIINGKRVKPPRFYDSIYELEYPEDFQRVKAGRRDPRAWVQTGDETVERRRVRERVMNERMKRLARKVDSNET